MLSTLPLGRATRLLSATVITAVCVGMVPADPGQHVLGLAFPLALSAYAQSNSISDKNVYPEPPLPSLTAAGSKVVDPTFDTTILRLTDSGDSTTDCSTTYANKPLLNYNSTRIAANCRVGSKRFKIWDFNPTTMVRSNPRIQANPPSGMQEYGAIWSHTNASKFYSCANKAIYEVTVPVGASTTFTNTIVRNFAADFTGTSCTQLSMSDNDDVFAFHTSGGAFIAYKRSTNTILLNVQGSPGSGTQLDEVEIDKSGRYLVVCCDPSHVYDLQATPSITNTVITAQDSHHRAMGSGIMVNTGSSSNLVRRSLATPNTVTTILTGWSYSTTQDHFAMSGSDSWLMACRYRTNAEAVVKAYDNECLEVSTTGNGAVRRHVHHRSNVLNNDYEAQPKGSVSDDGRFIAFTSNWGNANGRRDLYIAKIIQSSTSSDVSPPAVPTNFRIQ